MQKRLREDWGLYRMIKKDTIFDFMINVMVVFAIAILSICFFTFLFGEEAEGISTLFALGEKGIPLSTVVQFLALAFMITMMQWIFFTDKIIKTLSLTLRIIFMFVMIIIMIAVFAAVFQWFPVNRIKPWIMFFICFAIYATVSVIISSLKEKKENEKLQEALELLNQEDV